MSRIPNNTVMLAVLGIGNLSSPALACSDRSDATVQSRGGLHLVAARGRMDSGLDRQREFIFDSCMANGGTLPPQRLSKSHQISRP